MEITIRKPDDYHIHLRQEPGLTAYAKEAEKVFNRVIVMPNIKPAVNSLEAMRDYQQSILNAAPGLKPLMTFKISDKMTKEDIQKMTDIGFVVGKYYPMGATTNSEDGVKDITSLSNVLSVMEDLGIPFSFHGEDPDSPVLEREKAFIPAVEWVLKEFPRLKVVFEHISSAESVDFVLNGPDRLAATVTPQHLLYTLDDLMGGGFKPHLFCKPVLKTAKDRDKIQQAVLSGHPRIFFGSDSAPHLRDAKECSVAAAGSFSTPVAVPMILAFLEKHNGLDKAEAFFSENGARFYGLDLTDERVTYRKTSWTVPGDYSGVIPLMANRELSWKLV